MPPKALPEFVFTYLEPCTCNSPIVGVAIPIPAIEPVNAPADEIRSVPAMVKPFFTSKFLFVAIYDFTLHRYYVFIYTLIALDITLIVELEELPIVTCNNILPELIVASNVAREEPLKIVPYSVKYTVVPSCIAFNSVE